MNRLIGLLRGINVGGRNSLPMKELRGIFERLGAKHVKSYIQSGNVVFQSETADTESLADDIREAIKDGHGFAPQLLILRYEEMRDAVASNPFPEGEEEPRAIHLFFLAASAGSPDLAKLEDLRAESERFKLVDRVFYLYAPDGIGRSKLAARVEKTLGVPVTARNWRSVNKILALALATAAS